MGMWRAFYPQCDVCLSVFDDYSDFYSSRVRESMKRDGWRLSKTFVCPDCVNNKQEEQQ